MVAGSSPACTITVVTRRRRSLSADWDEADTRYWYRKFYTETRTGQLMALRPDDPRLFYYERTGPDVMGAIGVLQQSLLRIKFVLWILVIISVINLVIHWK